jgi:hypothetical protein
MGINFKSYKTGLVCGGALSTQRTVETIASKKHRGRKLRKVSKENIQFLKSIGQIVL